MKVDNANVDNERYQKSEYKDVIRQMAATAANDKESDAY
jgi:hypothetical protein